MHRCIVSGPACINSQSCHPSILHTKFSGHSICTSAPLFLSRQGRWGEKLCNFSGMWWIYSTKNHASIIDYLQKHNEIWKVQHGCWFIRLTSVWNKKHWHIDKGQPPKRMTKRVCFLVYVSWADIWVWFLWFINQDETMPSHQGTNNSLWIIDVWVLSQKNRATHDAPTCAASLEMQSAAKVPLGSIPNEFFRQLAAGSTGSIVECLQLVLQLPRHVKWCRLFRQNTDNQSTRQVVSCSDTRDKQQIRKCDPQLCMWFLGQDSNRTATAYNEFKRMFGRFLARDHVGTP